MCIFTLKDIVRNRSFESTTRFEAASIEYPRVTQTSRTTLLSRQPQTPADIFSLTRMPSESTCKDMKNLCQKGNYAAVDCELGAFNLQSIEVLLKIHCLRNVKYTVLKEQQWLKKEIKLPDPTCSYSKENLASYANKIFNTPNHNSALSSNQFILASDLATIAGTGWLTLCVLTGIAEILNRDSEGTAALILNNVVLVEEDDLSDYVNSTIRRGVKYVILFANVGKTNKNEVFIGKPGHQGNHWTLLYIDLTVNKWYYVDTFCWGMPANLKSAVSPFVTAIYQQGDMVPKPVSGIVQAHIQSLGLSHSCSKACLKNIPLQTCANVCGVAVAVLGGIASLAPGLWRNVFLSRNTDLPTSLKWLLTPTVYSDFLRCSIISWLLTDSIDVSTLGIRREQTKPLAQGRRPPFRRRFLGEVIIPDDERENENMENIDDMEPKLNAKPYPEDDHSRMETHDDSWIKVQYKSGRKKKKVDNQKRQGDYNKKSVLEENNGVPPSKKSKKPKDKCNTMKSLYHDWTKVQQGGKLKVDIHRKQGRRNKNTTEVSAAPKKTGQDINGRCNNHGFLRRKIDRASDEEVCDSKEGNVGDEVAADEDINHNHCGDRAELKQEDNSTPFKEIDGMSKHSQNVSMQGGRNPAWENKGNTDEAHMERGKNDEEVSENVEESTTTEDAVIDSDRGVVYSLKVENQKHTDEMAETESTVSDKKFANDSEDCSSLSANHGSLGDVPIQERGKEDEINVNHISRDDNHASAIDASESPSAVKPEEVDKVKDNGKDDKRNVEMEHDVFFVGQKFHTLEELETAKQMYEDSHFCELWKRDVRTLTAAASRVPRRVSNANPDLTYYSLHLSCKFGGRNVETRVNRKRKTKSFRQGCPFKVYISLSENGQYLQVNRISSTHNHLLQQQIYEHLPRQRAARNKHVTKEIEDAIKLQANPKLLKQKIETATGKKVTLKDISNIKQNSKKNVQTNDIENVMDYLREQPGSGTDVVVDEDNNFKGIFYQDAHMQNIYSHFPEILLVDATYKLLDLRMPVYLLMCIDGDGLSEVLAMFIVAEETKEVIKATVELFKKHNPSWDKTKVVMSDKDFTERDVFKACFPAASLNICLYHTLRSFRREITCEKMGITSAERLRVLEIVFSLAHSKTVGEYEKHLDELKQSNIRSVTDYVMENWHPIREQWVACFKDKHMNLGETTNNRLESTFSKFKSVCSRYASLLQFCTEFMSVLQCLREERNHHYVMTISRRQTEFEHLCKDLQDYSKTLTPYAFRFVRGQYESVSKVDVLSRKGSSEFVLCGSKKRNKETVVTSSSHCDCSFFTRMSLPCKHIFKVRELVALPAFDESLLHKRWTMDFYFTTNRLSPALPILLDHEPEHCVEYVPVHEEERSTLTQSQKFKKGLKIAQVLASLVSEGGMPTFKRRYEVLDSLVKNWKQGHEVIVQELGRETGTKTDKKAKVPLELVKENKQTGNGNEGERGAEDEPVSDVNENTGQTCELKNDSKKWILRENSVQTNDEERNDMKSPDFSKIKMPPKILKRGRPKGAEVTVIGLPRKKKKAESQNNLLPFKKLNPIEKDRMILGSLSRSHAVGEAIAGQRLLNKEDILPVANISDTIRDEEMVDIHRVEKYFEKEAWLLVLESSKEKNCIDFVCTVCSKMIKDEYEDSIACDRCLLWSHFKCTSLKKRPKHRNWFCTSCRTKYL